MGVYIKGMKMPKACLACPCFDEKDYVCKAIIKMPKKESIYHCRPDWCPLVEVPPHGRLIDETDVIKHFVELANDPWNQNVCTSWSNAFAEAAGDICDMPTIIEAEEGE